MPSLSAGPLRLALLLSASGPGPCESRQRPFSALCDTCLNRPGFKVGSMHYSHCGSIGSVASWEAVGPPSPSLPDPIPPTSSTSKGAALSLYEKYLLNLLLRDLTEYSRTFCFLCGQGTPPPSSPSSPCYFFSSKFLSRIARKRFIKNKFPMTIRLRKKMLGT